MIKLKTAECSRPFSNLAYLKLKEFCGRNQIANCALKRTTLCFRLLIYTPPPPEVQHHFCTILRHPDATPAITQVVMISSQRRLLLPLLIQHSCPGEIGKAQIFLERRIASVCVFQAISLSVILPMLIVIQLVCSDPGSFSPLYWESVCSVVQTVSVKLL